MYKNLICFVARKIKYNHQSFYIRRFSTELVKQEEVFSPINYEYDKIPAENIRNFSIIAHVDHGKSTLADRLLEITGTIKSVGTQNQILDKLQVERERGITVKAQTASLIYNYKGKPYLLNLIDTPGHVDFANEVSRSLAACQGVILLVDANHGVQAQTVANFYLAFGRDLTIIPVLNKCDLKNANPDRACEQLQTLFDIPTEEVLRISAKMGTNVEQVLDAVVEKIPHPVVNRKETFKALLFDSWYDKFRGVLSLIYVTDGEVKVGDQIAFYHTGKTYEVKTVSMLRPDEEKVEKLVGGQVGLIGCNMRTSKEALIGDTLHLKGKTIEPFSGFKPAQPMVFAGVYPAEQSQHVMLRSAIEKLVLNDSAVSVSTDSSPALGQGWRLGFLGLLHLEVFSQRLQQEHGAEPILTAPSVTYKVKLHGKRIINEHGSDEIFVSNPALMPDDLHIIEYFEPMVKATILTPDSYMGPILGLCIERRGIQKSSTNVDDERVMLQFEMPLCEVVLDFHDKIKSMSSGYASFDYEDIGYKSSNLAKMYILLNGQIVDELTTIVHVTKASQVGKALVAKLKEQIPRQMVQIAIQASVNGKIVGRETIKAFRKDVTAKLYGGDVTRRMKLLKQQAEGKKKMRSIANIQIPRNTFIDVLKR
ncbi:translation factor GUF1 homolog, mitochondrial [Ctenocephalides felis]|uniref:translation factor GUF1 homolog, mitochondrial n=1 Tax=Ctenocephalides felis TaxID=7515 RepID=UPI000E6E428C|nr:translation factor GUF1 homolog, mitochondrial [Ctenocephalides felis]